ncbi:MAG TPA: hypothetical protein VMV22_05530 [Acidimicrobiales bacterium]|nr:hypothetical protein [Acidimicrobiales bacterium]
MEPFDLVAHPIHHHLAVLGRQLCDARLVESEHLVFEQVDRHMGLEAVRSLHLAADAVEVAIGPSVAPRLTEAQPVVTAVAEEGALQVVVMDAALLARSGSRLELVLDLVEERLGDERLVAAGVLGTVERDDPDVVAVLEHGSDHGTRQGPGWLLPVREGLQAPLGQGQRQGGERPLPGAVGLESPAHMGCPLWIDLHQLDRSILDHARHIAVADRRPPRRAPHLGLAGHPLQRFGTVVA